MTAIIFILALATKMFLLPIFLIQSTGRDAYIAIAIIAAYELVMLGIMLVAICLGGDKNIFELMSDVFGKVAARIIAGIFAVYMFFKLNICMSEALLFYADNVFADFNIPVLIIVLLFFFAAVGKHTLRALCRLNEFLVPIIAACLAVLIAIVVMTGVDVANIFPSLRDAVGFESGLFGHTAWIGDFSALVMFVGRTKTKKLTGVFCAASGIIGSCVALFFAVVMSAALGNAPYLADTGTNLASILQFAIGNVYGRIDMFSSILWSVSVFIEGALFFYATCRCIAFAVGKNSHVVISLVVAVLLYVAQVTAMTDQTIFSVIVTSKICSYAVPIFAFVVPAVALVCVLSDRHRTRGDRNNKRKEEGVAA